MKTNEVKACVTRQLRRLQVLPEPQRRAELAELRRGVGRQPGDLPALWGALLADMPEQLQGSNGPSKAEWGRLYGVDPVCPAPAGGSRCFP